MTADQKTVVAVNEKNDEIAKNKRICNELNVAIIITINYDELEKLCKKNNLQLFVFQYDNINVQIGWQTRPTCTWYRLRTCSI